MLEEAYDNDNALLVILEQDEHGEWIAVCPDIIAGCVTSAKTPEQALAGLSEVLEILEAGDTLLLD